MIEPVDSSTETRSAAVAARAPAAGWLSAGLDLVFPPSCAFCHAAIESSAQGLLCGECLSALVSLRAACPRCGSSLAETEGIPRDCPRCRREKLHFQAVSRLGVYEDSLRTAVLRIKKSSERALAMALAELCADRCAAHLSTLAPDAVVPVPMHWSRKLWRGANSPESIAECLARRLGVPSAPHLLARCRRTRPQASLSPAKRLSNVRGAFRVRRHADLPGARLLLVDDIMTTGATVNEAAKTLARSGASFVGVVVLARAEAPA